jgi:phospholipid/cholesterol/gamma-HCH transport system substrate-binding protein
MPSARQIQWAKLRVGVAITAALAIISVLFYLLTGGALLTPKVALYTYVNDATGLAPESAVQVQGVDVGTVSDVALSGSNLPNRVIRVNMTVEREHLHDIPADSFVQLNSDLVGNRFVQITRGMSPTEIRPNSEITFKPQVELLKTLDMQQFADQLRIVDAQLTDIEQGRNRVGQFVLGRDVYDNLVKQFAGLERDFQAAIAPDTDLGAVVYTDQMYRQIREPVLRIDQALARLQAGQGQLGQLLREDTQYEQMRNQIASLRRQVTDIENSPFLQSDEQYVAWSRAVRSMIEQVDQITAGEMFSSTATYDNLAGAVGEMRDTIHDLRQNPQKYLRIKVF